MWPDIQHLFPPPTNYYSSLTPWLQLTYSLIGFGDFSVLFGYNIGHVIVMCSLFFLKLTSEGIITWLQPLLTWSVNRIKTVNSMKGKWMKPHTVTSNSFIRSWNHFVTWNLIQLSDLEFSMAWSLSFTSRDSLSLNEAWTSAMFCSNLLNTAVFSSHSAFSLLCGHAKLILLWFSYTIHNTCIDRIKRKGEGQRIDPLPCSFPDWPPRCVVTHVYIYMHIIKRNLCGSNSDEKEARGHVHTLPVLISPFVCLQLWTGCFFFQLLLTLNESCELILRN